jgi:aryl-alcohol dehydrogenase-like predicted oxidoreductase
VIKGGWQLAGGHGAFDRAEAVADMARFLDAGIAAFDCADIYTGVEEMIGDFIRGLRRDRGAEAADSVRVHTKLVPDLARLADYSAADVEAVIDRSLARLGVDRLHLVQFFWWDLAVGDPVGVLSSLRRLQRKGKIQHLGTTNFDETAMARFAGAGLDLATAQVQFSLLDQRPAGGFADWCAAHDVHILCYGVLAGGFLSERWLGVPDPGYAFENRSLTKYRLIIDAFGGWDLFQSLLATLDRIARKHGVAIGAVASRWALSRPRVGAVIIGARTAKRLAETLTVFDLTLDAADHAAIDAILARRTGPNGPVYALESDRAGPHGRIMKYNLGNVK